MGADLTVKVHFWKHGGIGMKVDEQHPIVMGHEASGTVRAVGSKVTTVAVGDHVALEPGVSCRRCKACKTGRYNHCPDMKFAAAPPDSHGTLTKFYLTSEDFVYKVRPGISLQEAVLVEPLAVAVHSVRLAPIRAGEVVVVMGSGTVGLLCAAVAKAFGALSVMVVDISSSKLAFARSYLQCATHLTQPGDQPTDIAAQIRAELSLPEGCDTFIEATGVESCLQAGIYLLKPCGNYIQTGVGKPMAQVPIQSIADKELKVHGCFRYGPGDFEMAVDFVNAGVVELKQLVSSVVPFHDATEAWEKTARGEGIKNLIQGA